MERDLEALYLSEFPAGQKAMSASRQVIDYTMRFAKDHACESILDAGSGMSSVFFHSLLDGMYVRSCDDDPDWAFKSAMMVEKITGKSILVGPLLGGDVFDIVFYDYGNIERRIFSFKTAVSQAGRYMVIDDMQVWYYRAYVQEVCAGKELRFLPETLDEYGRYAALLVI